MGGKNNLFSMSVYKLALRILKQVNPPQLYILIMILFSEFLLISELDANSKFEKH